jgi:hypothetical protein
MIVPTHAQTTPEQEALREVAVMRNIFSAVLEQDGKTTQSPLAGRVRLNDALYLAHQGMLFSFSFGGQRMMMGPGQGMMNPGMPDAMFDSMLGMDMPDMGDRLVVRNRAGGGPDTTDPYQQELLGMRQQLRQGHQEIRDNQRKLRDLMRQTQNDQARRSEIESLQSQLQSQQAELLSIQEDYRQLQVRYREENAQVLNTGKREKSSLLFQALCDYGNTFRSLGSGEYVTLIFLHYLDDEDMGFVISRDNLRNCTEGDMLSSQATTYKPR